MGRKNSLICCPSVQSVQSVAMIPFLLRFVEVEQLHFEDEGGARRNAWWLATIAVGHRGWADDLRLLALLHLLHRFRPARHNAIQWELDGLTALDRAVEDGAVHEFSLVVDLHHVGRSRARAAAGSDRAHDDAGRGLRRVLLLGGLVRKLL